MTFKQFLSIMIEKSRKAISRLGMSTAETSNADGHPENSEMPAWIPPGQPGQTVGDAPASDASDMADSMHTIHASLTGLNNQLSKLEARLRASQLHAAPQPSISPTNTSPWELPVSQAAFFLLSFALTVGLILFLRLFQLDKLQNEIYGDINIVRDFVSQILVGVWPYKFNLSAGPLYEYLITPIILVTGLNYLGLKIASVIVSLACLAMIYAFSRKLVNDYFALLVMFIAGVSSWLLVFSRLGNLLIVVPLLTVLALWLVIRIVQFGRQRDVLICAVVSALGLFIYPQTFILPGVIFATLLCLRWAGKPLPRGWTVNFILVSLLFLFLFVQIVLADPSNFTSGYVGNKINPEEGKSVLSVFGGNVINALLGLHVRGDAVFRSNPNSLPHLDWISGILFLVGIAFWLINKERRSWVALWLVPFILLEIPSMLALNQPLEVPSASRTLGVAPIVYMLVASGLWWPLQAALARGKRWRWSAILVTALLLGSILFLNAQRYFQDYIDGLPYHDTPIGLAIGTYANSLPENTQIYMVGCCWESGMPEYYVNYTMVHPELLHYIDKQGLTCAILQSTSLPAVYIWSFYDDLPGPQLQACKQWLQTQVYYYQGRPVFNAAALHPDSNLVLVSNDQQPDETPQHEQIQLDGQATDVEYSSIDIGAIGDVFDGNLVTLIRGQSANPMVVALHFSQPREIKTLGLNLGSMPHFHVELVITYADNTTQAIGNEYQNLADDPHIEISLPENPQLVTGLRLMVQNMNPADNDGYHIHIREIQLR